MRILRAIATSSLVAAVAAQSNITCMNGAYIIVARESDAPPGFGYLGTVKDQLIAKIPGSTGVAVTYPATITGPVLYFQSVPEGVGNMTQLVQAYGDACPGHKMVLMGYSQGAQVVGDVLLGDVNSVFALSNPIDTKYRDNVAAVVLMGDPSKVANQSYLVGNSTKNGIFSRTNGQLWFSEDLANRTVSYCDAGDTYCDSGPPGDYGHIVHNGYIAEYGSQAVQFVLDKYAAATSSNGTTTSSGSGGTSTTAAPSSTTSGSRTTGSTAGSATSPASATSTTASPNSATISRGSLLHAIVACVAGYTLSLMIS